MRNCYVLISVLALEVVVLMARERLQSYSVHERPEPAKDRIERAEALEFVRDGFLRKVFVFPPVWLATHGAWMAVLAYCAAAVAIVTLAWLLLLPPFVTVLSFIALHLIFAGEADEMLRAHLAARGFTILGHVTGSSRLDCERRFYDNWLPSEPAIKVSFPPIAPVASTASRSHEQSPRRSGGTILGNLLAPLSWRNNG